jgi:hypothetical protein
MATGSLQPEENGRRTGLRRYIREPGSLSLERGEALKSAVSTETGGEANYL